MAVELTEEGLVVETVAEIKTALENAFRAAFGDTIDVTATSAFGQLIGIHADREFLLQDALRAAYNSRDPDNNSGTAQQAVAAITGTVKEVASASSVELTLTGDNATVVPEGSQVATSTFGDIFETTADATLATLTSWAALTAYSLGAKRTNNARCYIVITAGTSAASGGPTTTGSDITDGSVHWKYLGEGTASAVVDADAEETGPIEAAAGIVTVIESPVAGWDNAVNLEDATLGSNDESSSALRVRREEELFVQGDATHGAVLADILRVEGVTACRLFKNTSDTTVDGLPAHSVEAVVLGGADEDIWEALAGSVALGIGTHGLEVGSVVDENGESYEYKFSRPEEVDVYLTITVYKDARLYPLNAADTIKAAIVAAGDLYQIGRNVTASAISAMVFDAVGGVLDTEVLLDDAPNPTTDTTIEISRRQIAVFDTSRIEIVSVTQEP